MNPTPIPSGITHRTFNAGLWVVAGRLVARSLDVVMLVVLARLLSPSDFGLIAIAMTFILLVEALLELPMMQALVRFEVITDRMFETAFSLGLLRGLGIAALMSGLAWPIARFYGDERLLMLIPALAIAPIMRGLGSPRMIIFMKNLDFRYEFAVDLLGKVAALIVVFGVGFATRSYWAIAAGTIVAPAVVTVLSYILAPLRPRLSLSEWPLFKELVGWNGATQLILALSWQLDRLLLGRMTDLTTFGRYSVANDLSALPHQALIQPLIRPLMAALANISSPESLRRAYAEASGAILFVGTPIMVAIFSLASPVVQLGLGDKWAEAAPILAFLSLSGLLLLPTTTVPMIAMLMNKTHYVTIRVFIEFMIKLPLMIVGIIYFGVWGAIAARFVSSFVAVINSMILMRKLIGLSITRQLIVLFRPFASGIIMACALGAMEHWQPATGTLGLVIVLTFKLGAGLLVYGLADLLVWRLQGAPSGVERYLLKRFSNLVGRRLEFGKE